MHIVRQIIDIIIVAEDKIAMKVMSLMLKSLTGFFTIKRERMKMRMCKLLKKLPGVMFYNLLFFSISGIFYF
jgi:hypothetical protein